MLPASLRLVDSPTRLRRLLKLKVGYICLPAVAVRKDTFRHRVQIFFLTYLSGCATAKRTAVLYEM